MNGKTNLFSPSQAPARQETCKVCEEGVATLSMEPRLVQYGRRDVPQLETQVMVPTWNCDLCGMSYLGEGAEELQHNAICEMLGRLTPDQIIKTRKTAGLSQAAFAEELEVGIASLKRWELGTSIQDKRNDRQIRGFASAHRPNRQPIFRCPISQNARARADHFKLRPCDIMRDHALQMAA